MGFISRTKDYIGVVQWQKIKGLGPSSTLDIYRTQVPGGWLVTKGTLSEEPGGLAFIPDPDFSWQPTDE